MIIPKDLFSILFKAKTSEKFNAEYWRKDFEILKEMIVSGKCTFTVRRIKDEELSADSNTILDEISCPRNHPGVRRDDTRAAVPVCLPSDSALLSFHIRGSGTAGTVEIVINLLQTLEHTEFRMTLFSQCIHILFQPWVDLRFPWVQF